MVLNPHRPPAWGWPWSGRRRSHLHSGSWACWPPGWSAPRWTAVQDRWTENTRGRQGGGGGGHIEGRIYGGRGRDSRKPFITAVQMLFTTKKRQTLQSFVNTPLPTPPQLLAVEYEKVNVPQFHTGPPPHAPVLLSPLVFHLPLYSHEGEAQHREVQEIFLQLHNKKKRADEEVKLL